LIVSEPSPFNLVYKIKKEKTLKSGPVDRL